jgi:hypothetical protein
MQRGEPERFDNFAGYRLAAEAGCRWKYHGSCLRLSRTNRRKDRLMRRIEDRLQKLEHANLQKAVAFVWRGRQSQAELQGEIEKREAEGFSVVVIGWQP